MVVMMVAAAVALEASVVALMFATADVRAEASVSAPGWLLARLTRWWRETRWGSIHPRVLGLPAWVLMRLEAS